MLDRYPQEQRLILVGLRDLRDQFPDLQSLYATYLLYAQQFGFINARQRQVLLKPRLTVSSQAIGNFVGFDREDQHWATVQDIRFINAWNRAVREGIINGVLLREMANPHERIDFILSGSETAESANEVTRDVPNAQTGVELDSLKNKFAQSKEQAIFALEGLGDAKDSDTRKTRLIQFMISVADRQRSMPPGNFINHRKI